MDLREYQRADVEFIKEHKCCGIFSEQRTGKSAVVVKAISELGIRKSIVVCPLSVIPAWENEFSLWSDLETHIVTKTDGSDIPLNYNGVLLINWEKFRGSKKNQEIVKSLIACHPNCVVLDEAHKIKDRNSLQAKSAFAMKNVEYKFAVTGTPCTNKPWDIWSILHWLKPRQWSSYWNFINEYFYSLPIYLGGRTVHEPMGFREGREAYLQAQLSNFCVQHKQKEVMDWVEAVEPIDIKLKPSVSEVTAIQSLEKYFHYKHILTQGVLDTSIRVRQICNHLGILDLKGKSTKTTWLLQYLEDYKEESIIIFSNSKRYLKILNETTGHPIICGDTPIDERKEIIANFQKEIIKVVLLQTQSCKEGITLDTADTTIFMDVCPPAADYLQAKDRMIATCAERAKPKKLFRVMLLNTLDEKYYESVDNNISASEAINNYAKHIERVRQ